MKLECYRELARDYLRGPGTPGAPETHMHQALDWLYRAQDSSPDGGVSHSYRLDWGWLPSYPEVTGYIIPSVLNWWKSSGDETARERALRMASWETEVQLPRGGIPSLMNGRPVIFDTGQVIFGWLSAYATSNREEFLRCAIRAGDWLLGEMDDAGVWRGNGVGDATPHTYDARSAWALLELDRVTHDRRYRDAAGRFLAWTLEQETARGWFAGNCLTDNDRPLLHTIAYTAQGQLEGGLILDDERLVAAARRTAEAVCGAVDPAGRVAGRFDRNWNPTVRWACLTGMAQMCLVWSRLFAIDDRCGDFQTASESVLRFLRSTQNLSAGNEGLRGGIKGSFPVNGAYGRYSVLSWATKFFLDAEMEWSGKTRTFLY